MTVKNLLLQIDSHELTEWMTFDVIEAQAKKKALDEERLTDNAVGKLAARKGHR